MGYFYRGTAPKQSEPAAAAPPEGGTPTDGTAPADQLAMIIGLLEARHGKAVAEVMVRYAANLKNACTLLDEIQRMGAHSGADGSVVWEAEAELRSAEASLRTVSDCIAELPGEAITPSLLATLPGELLGRILVAGFEAEADALADLRECVFPPGSEMGSTEGLRNDAAPGCAGSNSHPNANPG